MRIKMKRWKVKAMTAGLGIAAGLVMLGCENVKPRDSSGEIGATEKTVQASTAKKAAKVDFLTEVKPLLESYCLRCHNTRTLLGELNLETRELAFEPGENGPFIIPGDPQASKFYRVLKLLEDDKAAMPPTKHRMSEEQRELIYRWIEQGAKWPKDSRGTLRPVREVPVVAMLDDLTGDDL